MKTLLLAVLFSTVWTLQAFAALRTGDTAPDIQLQASLAGKAFSYSLKEALKTGPVVVYFYPSAYTGGCNIQAHTFAENHDKFAAAGATVLGVSLDNIDRLNEFSADPQYCANKVAVASDVDGSVSKAYELVVKEAAPGKKDTRGADITHGFAERTTFVITPNGKVSHTISGLKPAENVAKALEIVQQLAASKPAL
jgi:peroxiredoxin